MAELSTTIVYGDLTVTNDQYVKGQLTIDGGLTVNGTIDANDVLKDGNTVATESWVSSNFNNYSLETHDNSHHSNTYATESWVSSNFDNSGNTNDYVDGVSGSGDGTLTINRTDGGSVSTDLSHSHGNNYYDDNDAISAIENTSLTSTIGNWDWYTQSGGRILLRAQGSGGGLGFYDEANSTWYIRQYNGGDLELNAEGNVNSLTTLQQNGNSVALSSGTQYDIQKNGSDGSGVINFKT